MLFTLTADVDWLLVLTISGVTDEHVT